MRVRILFHLNGCLPLIFFVTESVKTLVNHQVMLDLKKECKSNYN
jgi:hypothetical protein